MRSRLPSVDSRVLTPILVVALPVLVIGAAMVISIGKARLQETQRARLTQVAEYTAGTIDASVFRRILDAAVLGRVPEIRAAAAESSARPFDAKQAAELDRQWQEDRAGTVARSGLLASPASRFLADLASNDSIYREVLVTDRHGRLVAASNPISDYIQSDEDWWIRSFDGGRGRVNMGDVRRDESAGVYAFEIAVPVPAPSGTEIAGVMKIVADSREMLAGIGGLEFGETAEAMLVRPNGSIVYSRRQIAEGDRFFAADLLREHLERREQRKDPPGPMTFRAAGRDGSDRLVILAPSQLGRTYPDLAWFVALSIDREELLAPFQSLVWYLVLVFAATAIAVLAIALWLSLRLATPSLDPAVDMQLVDHARMRRGEDADA
ncbi:MAG: cache domain-containing protein [Acidobacteriota bacterium]|nr:cache domain-containing protein [Acidobacteriota bacterium]